MQSRPSGKRSTSAIASSIVMIIVLVASTLGPFDARAWEYRSLGSRDYRDYESYYDPTKWTKVDVKLEFGDYEAWVKPRSVWVKWDERITAVSLVTIHRIGIYDDRGRLVEVFVDASAGGTGWKSEAECIVGVDICYIYKVVPEYRWFTVLKREVTETYRVYVKASSEAEARMAVELMFLPIALSLSIKSVVSLGLEYEVTVTVRYNYETAIMVFDGTIEKILKNFRTGSEELEGAKNFYLTAQASYVRQL